MFAGASLDSSLHAEKGLPSGTVYVVKLGLPSCAKPTQAVESSLLQACKSCCSWHILPIAREIAHEQWLFHHKILAKMTLHPTLHPALQER